MRLPYRDKARLTSPQGMRWGTPHRGIDLVGTDKRIYAVEGGKVVVSNMIPQSSGKIEWQFGNRIMIYGNDKVYATYQHLKERHVELGETVKEGQQIGVEGGTGYCVPAGASHLHFQVQDKRGAGFREYSAADYLGILNEKGTYEVVVTDVLTAVKCGLSGEVVAYLNKYKWRKALWDKLWNAVNRGKPMPSGKGNPDADLATAIYRKCGLAPATIRYIWGYADRQTVQRDIWIPLWFNMQ